jgi:uncharacterized protein YbjT (DUF2867 family)/uncharacterized protein YndB with AHSA1/START domain
VTSRRPGYEGEVNLSPGGRVLVTGASGYIGGRLVGELLAAGYRVRCLVRTPAKLDAASWRDQVEVVEGDVEGDLTSEAGGDGRSLGGALEGTDVAYYLIHSIGASTDWAARDRDAAANFRRAAAAAGVQRIVYLGGLGEVVDGERALSPHLRSRHEVGAELAAGPVPVTELRAAVIIGSGSASFEMLRYLVEVLPVMVTPRWVDTRCQPIAVRDVLRYLVQVLAEPRTVGRVLEIGGPEVLTYRELMDVYAEEAELRRRVVVPVPVLTPRLSSLWVGLVTPLPRSLARPLVDSLVNEVVVHDPAVLDLLPGPLLTCRTAVRLALGRVRKGEVTTSWAGAELGGRHPAEPMPTDPDWAGGTVLADERVADVAAPASVVFGAITAIGGDRGWYTSDWLWAVRGLADKVIGGPGMRRGRRHPTDLRVGDALDFWRVEALEPDRLLRLRAEMRVPGRAWLEWRLAPTADGRGTEVRQLARFDPRGLWGRVYWLGVMPFHRFVFPGLLAGLARDAVAAASRATPDPESASIGPQ